MGSGCPPLYVLYYRRFPVLTHYPLDRCPDQHPLRGGSQYGWHRHHLLQNQRPRRGPWILAWRVDIHIPHWPICKSTYIYHIVCHLLPLKERIVRNDKPYRHPAIENITRNTFFNPSTFATYNGLFHSSLTGSDECEVPIPMVALAATAVSECVLSPQRPIWSVTGSCCSRRLECSQRYLFGQCLWRCLLSSCHHTQKHQESKP